MLDPLLFAAFLTTTLLFVATPGPSVAYATAQAIKFGPGAAISAVLGDALGTMVHIIIAVGSLKTLIALSDVVLPYLQICGGLFVLFLAWQSFRHHGAVQGKVMPAQTRATFLGGFFACVTNPKAIVFFVALFPGFIALDLPVLPQTIVYGAVFIALDAASILIYALLAMVAFRRTVSARFSVDMLSGIGLSGVGVYLIVKGYRALPNT